MTARKLTGDELPALLDELAAAGHVVTPQAHIGGTIYRCCNCCTSLRHYDKNGSSAVFSDFALGQQCEHRQMNVMCLVQS